MSGGVRSGAKTAVLAALATGSLVADAAKDAGVSDRTVLRWQKEPDFQAEITRLRREMLDRAVGSGSGAMAEAMETLRELLKSKDEAIRARAARDIVNASIRLRQTVDLEERVARLEGERGA